MATKPPTKDDAEQPLPALSDLFAIEEVPARVEHLVGRRLHRSIPTRWCADGIAGVRLRSWRMGQRRLTTERALVEFFAAIEEARARQPKRTHAKKQTKKAQAKARGKARRATTDETLRRHGLLRA